MIARGGTRPSVAGAGPVGDVAAAAFALALDVEARDGRPQDVEWAWDGEQVWVVQARPITTLTVSVDEFDARPDQLEALDLTTIGIGETMPGVLSPLLWDINRHLVEEAFRTLFDRLGALDDEVDAARTPLYGGSTAVPRWTSAGSPVRRRCCRARTSTSSRRSILGRAGRVVVPPPRRAGAATGRDRRFTTCACRRSAGAPSWMPRWCGTSYRCSTRTLRTKRSLVSTTADSFRSTSVCSISRPEP